MSPTAVALVIHGLNHRPGRMLGIAQTLAGLGVECLNLSLSGHAESDAAVGEAELQDARRLETFKQVSRPLWLEEARAGHALVRARALEQGVPLLLVGYSLGAAVGSDIASDPAGDVGYDGMILFAPAFAVRWYTRFPQCLAPFPRLTLPSLSPPDYAANPGTPIAAYNALFSSITVLRRRSLRRLAPPALIFIDPRDELVSYRSIARLCEQPGAEPWSLVPVPKRLREGRRDYHHLIIDRDSVGEQLWRRMSGRLEAFLTDLTQASRRSFTEPGSRRRGFG